MSKKTIMDPVEKINNFLKIEVEITNNKITNATTNRLIYKNFEKTFTCNLPLTSKYFKQKIYNLYSNDHFLTLILALENSLNITPDSNSKKIRDFIHGFEFIQSHIKDFYLYIIPDFVKIPKASPLCNINHHDFRLPKKLTKKIYNDYLLAIKHIKLINQILNLLNNQTSPYHQNIFIGGATINMSLFNNTIYKSIIKELKNFINNIMIKDVTILADYYYDYFKNGVGYHNLMSYGCFNYNEDKEFNYVTPKVYINGTLNNLNPNLIIQNIYYSRFKDMDNNSNKNHWIKAPRYNKYPMEVGPLARMILSNNYRSNISTMDRIYALVLETKKIIEKIDVLLKIIHPSKQKHIPYKFPFKNYGKGLLDTPNGSLGHWLYINNNNKCIQNYNIIDSINWNLSPKDSHNIKGIIEKSLLGTNINNIDCPIEIIRIVHSFAPEIACTTNVLNSSKEPVCSWIV